MSATCKWFTVVCIAALLCYHEAWSSPSAAAEAVAAAATANDLDQDLPVQIEDIDLENLVENEQDEPNNLLIIDEEENDNENADSMLTMEEVHDAHSHMQQISSTYSNYRSYILLSCSYRSALYYLYSTFSSSYRDRRWTYGCRSLPSTTTTCISLSSNPLYGRLLAQCPTGYAISRIYSPRMTSTLQRDRIFSIRCCRSTSITSTCQFSSYINPICGTLSYSARSSYVITGLYSDYFSTYRDRRYRVRICRFNC